MSYAGYVFSAYLAFGLFLLWDYLMPRLQLHRTRRAIALRAQREAARNTGAQP